LASRGGLSHQTLARANPSVLLGFGSRAKSLSFAPRRPSPLKPPWIAMRGSIVKIRLLELAQHHAQFHQHAPHEVFLRLIAQTFADDLVQRLPGLRQYL